MKLHELHAISQIHIGKLVIPGTQMYSRVDATSERMVRYGNYEVASIDCNIEVENIPLTGGTIQIHPTLIVTLKKGE